MAVVFAAIVGVSYFMASYFLHGKQLPITRADRLLFPTAEELESLSSELIYRTDAEQLEKIEHFDSSLDLRYEYDLSRPENALYLGCLVMLRPNRQAAKEAYAAEIVIAKHFTKSADERAKVEIRNDLFRWGESSYYETATLDEQVIAYSFVACQGNRVYRIFFSGTEAENASAFTTLLLPHLNQLEGYKQTE